MFWKGQARLIAAFRFIRTFIVARSGGKRRQARFCQIALAQKGAARSQNPGKQGPENDRPASILPTLPYGSRQEKRATFMRLHDIIYRPSRLSFCENVARPTESRNRTAFAPALALPGPFQFSRTARLVNGRCRRLHQKHTNWSQIMQKPPQLGSFTGLHCIACIGGILLCLFLF
jgi:hypothetical protein